MYLKAITLLSILLRSAKAADNGLALTPQMGWNTWNHFGCSINEALILGAANALIQNNLTSLGYQCAYLYCAASYC
jgi:alpha-galactosidase